MDSTAGLKSRVSKSRAFFRLLRLNRSIMVAVITGSSAYAAGAGVTRALWMTLAGWCLAVGGFSLDFYADRDLDVEGPRERSRHNPLADGSLAPRTGLIFSLSFVACSLVLTTLASPLSLSAWAIVLAVIVGLALHLFETPLTRALTLGLLQALYVLLGGLAGQLSVGLLLLAGMFFFAMFGGRGMIDIRDYAQDQATRVQTLPKRYGVRRTAWFTAICLLIAFALSLAAYWTGEFGPIYLYLALVFVAVGLICATLFAARPTPRLAHVLTLVFMMGMGSLICLAMILGSAAHDSPGIVRGRHDDWYRAPPEEYRSYWNWPGLDPARIHIVPEEQQAVAQKLLERDALVEITTQQAAEFLGPVLPDAPGTTPYLVRGLCRNPGTGKYVVYVGESRIVVHHGSLGRSAPPVARQALVLQLEKRPAEVYVVSSVTR